MNRTFNTLALVTVLSTTALSVNAKDNQWEKEASDAWIDGKAEATLLFNTQLNSFDINTDVDKGVVTLTGKVNHDVDKKLAQELVIGIDGVKEVENRLTVIPDSKNKSEKDDSQIESDFVDAKIATVIKTRLLFDTDISGTSIDVDVENQNVTLTGEVDSEAEKQLAITIAKNADDVENVEDNLRVVKQS
ncbi:BON domain-containing protein [Pseudoalteromonas sp. XMcav1-K]|uniref:BON domain-containing protein n=1 Tax=Pseudoalteromonas sp. XMcav1-K TaxID=3374372 RepID=UPI0037572952